MVHKNNSRFGFTLAEMMIVMLILTIILAAFAPLMTKRNKAVDLSSPWRWASNNSDIYYGTGNNQTAMIGQKAKAETDSNSKLLITSADGKAHPHITFKEGNDIKAHIAFKGSNIFFGLTEDGSIPSFHGYQTNTWSMRDGYNNIALGIKALNSSGSGADNVAIGASSLESNTSGDNNVAIGSSSLKTNYSGINNVAIGSSSLKANTSGYNNVAMGFRALESNAEGNDNVAMGETASQNMIGSRNVAIGIGTLTNTKAPGSDPDGLYGLKEFKSNDSVAIGRRALAGMTQRESQYDVAIGPSAMASNWVIAPNDIWKSKNNVAIGAEALSTEYNNLENNIAIGNEACKSITSYNSKIASNNICIGSKGGTGSNRIYIGTAAHNVSVVGNMETNSDIRLKNIKSKFNHGLDVIRGLTTYNFTYKEDKLKNERVGIIAQDLQKVLPGAVEKNGDGYLTVKQEQITYTMLNAIKELDVTVQKIVAQVKDITTKIVNVEKQIKTLQKENKELKAKVNSLEKRLEKLEKAKK